LSGELPLALNKCVALQRLRVSENKLSGTLDIGFPTTMEFFSAYSNNFSGTIPASLAHCTKLQLLDLRKNDLISQLPQYLKFFNGLRVLSLGHNKLHGGIHEWITDLTQLQVLDLSNNKFNGKIPSNLHALKGFKIHGSSELSGNTLSEVVEIVIKAHEYVLTYVLAANTIFDLASNNLVGEIPPSIGSLSGLRLLNLSGNQLEGRIPASLSEISTLEQLDLCRNNLSGVIPQELSILTKLAYLDISWNKLCGRIPKGTQLDTFSEASFEGNNCLCGYPLQLCKEKQNNNKMEGASISKGHGWLSKCDDIVG